MHEPDASPVCHRHRNRKIQTGDDDREARCRGRLDRLVPENTPWFQHTIEGPDDMPSHIRMALTRTSETIPVSRGRMLLGTWQGIFLFEHRRAPHHREIVVTITGLA